jgi:serine/threonine protein kinase
MGASMAGRAFSPGLLFAGKYRLLRPLGEGAMGVVWAAVNTATNGQVALKLILRSEPELRQRLLREAQACGAVRHKNVVQVYDVGQTEAGDPFLVMELLQGETLASLLQRQRRLAPYEAAAIARDVARALAAAHQGGIVHRGLEPANIFLHTEAGEDGAVVKVVGFGGSKNLLQSDGMPAVAGGAVGSSMYMSPEQARAEREVDARTDLWSLGVVLYEMLTGERPFSGGNDAVKIKILYDPIPCVSHRIRRIDEDLDRIVAGCLTRDAAERLGPAAEIARQLEPHTLAAARGPLPTLLDAGARDAPPAAGPGSGGAALSPGPARAPLPSSSSSGIRRTDMRGSSSIAGPSQTSENGTTIMDVSALIGEEMYRSAASRAAVSSLLEDDDERTRPVHLDMLTGSRPASPAVPDESAEGRGTMPIPWPAMADSRAAPMEPPPPVAPQSVPSPHSQPNGIGPQGTFMMGEGVGAALVTAGPPPEWAAPPSHPLPGPPPLPAFTPAPPAPPARDPARIKPFVVAGIAILLSATAAVGVGLFARSGAVAPESAGPSAPGPSPPPTQAAAQPPAPAQSAAPSPPATASAVTAPADSPALTASAAPAATEPAPPPDTPPPVTTAAANPSAPKPATAPVTPKKPKTTGPKSTTSTAKPGCKSKFGVGCK